MLEALETYTGQKYLPNIFVGMNYIGGLTDLEKIVGSGKI
jgi:glutaredoxin